MYVMWLISFPGRSCPAFNVDLTSTGYICTNELKYKSECEFNCMQGHFMTKQSKVVDYANTVCDAIGRVMVWSEMPPSCEVKTCAELRQVHSMWCIFQLLAFISIWSQRAGVDWQGDPYTLYQRMSKTRSYGIESRTNRSRIPSLNVTDVVAPD